MLDINELFQEEYTVLEDARIAAASAQLPAEVCREKLWTIAKHYQRLIDRLWILGSKGCRQVAQQTEHHPARLIPCNKHTFSFR